MPILENERPLVAMDRNLASTGLRKIQFVGSCNWQNQGLCVSLCVFLPIFPRCGFVYAKRLSLWPIKWPLATSDSRTYFSNPTDSLSSSVLGPITVARLMEHSDWPTWVPIGAASWLWRIHKQGDVEGRGSPKILEEGRLKKSAGD